MQQHVLHLYSPLLLGKSFVTNLRDAVGWRRSIHVNGGYWRGNFTLFRPLDELVAQYYSFLGYHIEEKTLGEKSWEGLVYELTLNDGRTSRTRSLDMLYNHITATYIDNDGTVHTTAAATNDQSINRYGRREDLIAMDNMTSANARPCMRWG